ncbi:MAG: hypothetical protein J3R72DRAFT_444622 [Linnemannia gamsii]|nr:MAG: hypothetical protein J3R72DRAFT_444622 [Linnemannia gamsii]
MNCVHLSYLLIPLFLLFSFNRSRYGQKPELATTRAHSERYHQLKVWTRKRQERIAIMHATVNKENEKTRVSCQQ